MFEFSLLQQMLVGGFDVLFCEDGVAVLELRMFVTVFVICVAIVHLLSEILLRMNNAVLQFVRKAQNMGSCQNSGIFFHFGIQCGKLFVHLLDAVLFAVMPLEQECEQGK